MGGRVADAANRACYGKSSVLFRAFLFIQRVKPEKNRLSFLSDFQVPCLHYFKEQEIQARSL